MRHNRALVDLRTQRDEMLTTAYKLKNYYTRKD